MTKFPEVYEGSFVLEEGLYLVRNRPCRKYRPSLHFNMDETHTWIQWVDNKDVTIVRVEELIKVHKDVEVLFDHSLTNKDE